MERNQKLLKWLENEQLKDKKELDIEKQNLINQLKKLKKEDLLPEIPKQLTLWQRIKKVLMG